MIIKNWSSLLPRFNFIWFDATTFLPYTDEAAGESMMVKASGGLQLASITHVLAALTPNAKRIFLVLAKYQIEHQEAHYPGIAFMELYSRCRNEFLVSSDLELKAQVWSRTRGRWGSKRMNIENLCDFFILILLLSLNLILALVFSNILSLNLILALVFSNILS